jgi:hypothetical protein
VFVSRRAWESVGIAVHEAYRAAGV